MSSIRIAQTLGLTSAGIASGAILGFSVLGVPAILEAPNPLVVKQWQRSFDIGKLVSPLVNAISILSFGYLAYEMKGTLNQHKAELYAVCAVSNALLFPWTALIMMPTNYKLMDKCAAAQSVGLLEEITESGVAEGESAKQLIDKWSTMNVVRGLFPLIAVVMGTWITLG